MVWKEAELLFGLRLILNSLRRHPFISYSAAGAVSCVCPAGRLTIV